jgi:hypothetical protein
MAYEYAMFYHLLKSLASLAHSCNHSKNIDAQSDIVCGQDTDWIDFLNVLSPSNALLSEPEEFMSPQELDGRFRVKALKKVSGMTEEARLDVERAVQRGMSSRVSSEETIREAAEKGI